MFEVRKAIAVEEVAHGVDRIPVVEKENRVPAIVDDDRKDGGVSAFLGQADQQARFVDAAFVVVDDAGAGRAALLDGHRVGLDPQQSFDDAVDGAPDLAIAKRDALVAGRMRVPAAPELFVDILGTVRALAHFARPVGRSAGEVFVQRDGRLRDEQRRIDAPARPTHTRQIAGNELRRARRRRAVHVHFVDGSIFPTQGGNELELRIARFLTRMV